MPSYPRPGEDWRIFKAPVPSDKSEFRTPVPSDWAAAAEQRDLRHLAEPAALPGCSSKRSAPATSQSVIEERKGRHRHWPEEDHVTSEPSEVLEPQDTAYDTDVENEVDETCLVWRKVPPNANHAWSLHPGLGEVCATQEAFLQHAHSLHWLLAHTQQHTCR